MYQIGAFQVKQMLNIPPGSNPYQHDYYNMGTNLGEGGRNVEIMFGHRRDYVIIVDRDTGARIRVHLPEYKPDIAEAMMERAIRQAAQES